VRAEQLEDDESVRECFFVHGLQKLKQQVEEDLRSVSAAASRDCYSPVPVRAAPPPDDKQPCIEDFFLSSARVPVLLPARSASSDAERFNDAQGGEAELSGELARADLHWSAPTALDEPGFVSAWEDSEYVDGNQQDIGESLYGVPFDDACSRAQDSGECFDSDVDVDFDVESDAVKPSFDRPNLLSFETSELMRRFNEEFWARQGKAPFDEPEYNRQAAERARSQVERCDDCVYAADRLRLYLHPPLYVAGEVDRGALFGTAAAAEPALFYVPHASDTSAAVDKRSCEWSAGDLHADYDEYGAYYDSQYSAGWRRLMMIPKSTLARHAAATASGSPTCKRSARPREYKSRVACRVKLL
jgi:hypothetical protein